MASWNRYDEGENRDYKNKRNAKFSLQYVVFTGYSFFSRYKKR
jgi:hypothetical protein